MSVYQYENYKEYVNFCLKSLPKKGYGQAAKMAQALNVSSTLISQIFKGSVDLTVEQAIKLAQYLSLSERETEYFVNLVQFNRSSDISTKAYFETQLKKIKAQENSIKIRLKLESNLNEIHQAEYYSEWYLAASWLLTAIPNFRTRTEIANYLQISPQRISAAIDSLIKFGLVEEQNDQLKFKGKHIHIAPDSALVFRHHSNWRWVAVKKMESTSNPANLNYTGPVVVTKADALKIKEILLQTLQKFSDISGPSDCEELHCLNIDWFKV